MGDFLPDKSVVDRRVVVLFGALLAAGIILRVAASVLSQGFVHPDEHQQYLEVAQGIVYGPWVKFWEYERGTRHYFYPSCLALFLYSLDLIGVRDSLYQATIIRALLAIAIFVGIALLARDWLRQGRIPAALCLLALAALSPDVIYMSIRTLSETAATIPFVLSLYFFKRDPFLTGFLLGIMFAVRFQTAFLIPGFFALSLYDDWSARQWRNGSTWRLMAGLTISLLAVGLMDKLTWGRWFHSPLECFQANIIEGIAAGFGVSPWYQYLDWGAQLFAEAVPLLGLILIALGIVRERRLAFVGLIFLIGHSVIDRKDQRFLWPLAPIGLMVFAAGFEMVYRWLPERWGRVLFVAVLFCCLAGGSWIRIESLEWEPEPSRSSSQVLAKVGRYPDVTGVLVLNLPSVECGNYFYLRRDVPLLVRNVTDPSDITSHPLWNQGKINYVIACPKDAALLAKYRLDEIDAVHGLGIYKVGWERLDASAKHR
jgi:phosphatidylinositol glycan class B